MNHDISRRDFLKVAGMGLGALALDPFKLDKAFPSEGLTSKEFDPHSLLPIYPWNTMTGLLIDCQGKLQRSDPPPKNIEDALQNQLHISVPWIGPSLGKPDAPGGVCTFTKPGSNGDHVQVNLVDEPEIKFEMSDDEPPAQENLDIRKLVPHFDQHTGNTFITTESDLVVRVIPPPTYQQKLADRNYTAEIPYHRLKPGYFDIPFPPGRCVITTDAGQASEKVTSTDLQYTRSIKLVK